MTQSDYIDEELRMCQTINGKKANVICFRDAFGSKNILVYQRSDICAPRNLFFPRWRLTSFLWALFFWGAFLSWALLGTLTTLIPPLATWEYYWWLEAAVRIVMFFGGYYVANWTSCRRDDEVREYAQKYSDVSNMQREDHVWEPSSGEPAKAFQ